jgi:hypothetical protein
LDGKTQIVHRLIGKLLGSSEESRFEDLHTDNQPEPRYERGESQRNSGFNFFGRRQQPAVDENALAQLEEVGITSAEDVAGILYLAELGQQYITSSREYAAAQAVRAYGPTEGPRIAQELRGANIDRIISCALAWEARADHDMGLGRGGERASRASAYVDPEAGYRTGNDEDEIIQYDNMPQPRVNANSGRWAWKDQATREHLLSQTARGRQILAAEKARR